MTKHTKGEGAIKKEFNVFADNTDSETVWNENIANAHLISAAPDLLEALESLAGLEVRGQALIDRLQFSKEGRVLSAKITNALNKAKGIVQ
jgi:hypothetical protein